jgi:hypothetical protein
MIPFTKLDVIIIAALTLSGTSAAVEANNRITIEKPDAVEAIQAVTPAIPERTAYYCHIAAPNGEFGIIQYMADVGAATADALQWACY